MQLCGSLRILCHCLSLGLEWKLIFSSPAATGLLSFPNLLAYWLHMNTSVLQHHILGLEIVQRGIRKWSNFACSFPVFLIDFLSWWSIHWCKWGIKAPYCYCIAIYFSLSVNICLLFSTYLCRLEKGMATHSSIIAWKITRTEEPGGLQSMGCKDSGMTEWFHSVIFSSLETLAGCFLSLCWSSHCSFPVIGKHFYDYFFELLSGRLLISISLR